MSPTTCPTCGKVVDQLRARSVGVRDGKVVAYCSAACAAAAESRPVSVKIRTPPAGVAAVIPTTLDSGPIIEIIREGSVPTESAATGKDTKPKADKPAPARRDPTPTPVDLAKRKAELAAAEEADDDAEINGDDAPPARKVPVLLILIVVLAIGGGVALVLKMMSNSGTAHAAGALPRPEVASLVG